MTKSKAWSQFVTTIDNVLERMYDTDPMGAPLHEGSPELMDPINRIANTQIEINGYFYKPFTEHAAKRIVLDELKHRKTKGTH